MISSPDHGVTARYTWLTTSDDALFHIKMCFGKLENYRKICLMTDGAECICKGKNISFRGRQMLQQSDSETLISHLEKSEPQDDASLLILEIMI